MKEVLIEGYKSDEILAVLDDRMDALVLCGEPIVFRAGTAQILGEFRIVNYSLEIQLAQIDGGGEGVLPTLWTLADRYAQRRRLKRVEWIVHALNCAKPNPKLRRVLERKGFSIAKVRGNLEAFVFHYEVCRSETQS